MFRKVLTGASAVLAVGMLAVGCSEDGDTFTIGGTGVLPPQNFPAGAIADFNVAPDGGGISPNTGDPLGWKVTFACDCCDSDGEFVGDNSAIILFQVDNENTDQESVFACHYDGSTLTPPVELRDPDRDEDVPVDLDSAICHFIGTSTYQGATQDITQQAQAKQGNWVILYTAFTEDEDPRSGDPEVTGIEGPRWGVFGRFFVKSLRGDANEVVMADPTSAWGNQSGLFRYGFQVQGREINEIRTAGAVTGLLQSNVQSFGLVSDGLCGQSCWEGDGTPHDNNDDPNDDSTADDFVADAGDLASVEEGDTSFATGNSYRTGEATTFVHLFFTQIANSRSTEGPNYSPGNDSNVASRMVMQEAALNLATLEFASPSPVEPTTDRNQNVGGATVGTGFYPTFYTYNDLCFYSYADGDLLDGTGVDEMMFEFPAEKIIGKLQVVADTATGSSDLEDNEDLSVRGGNSHDLVEQDTSGGNTERAFFNDDGTFIFGSDEGLGDTSIFFLATDGTAEGGLDDVGRDNFHQGVYVGLVDEDGQVSTDAANNPALISPHADDDPDSPAEDDAFPDNVSFFDACMNRTGTYIALAYIQNEDPTPSNNNAGDFDDFFTALKVVIYAPFRPQASSTDPNATTLPEDLEDRFTAPQIVSDETTNVDINDNAGPGPGFTPGFNGSLLPVNDFMWQGKLGYRCATQSDPSILWILWEQSDTTEDRVFARAIDVDLSTAPPSFTPDDIAEFEANAGEAVASTDHDTNGPLVAGGIINQFNFLENSVHDSSDGRFLDDVFAACDLGPTDAQDADATDGGLFVVFAKIVDNTDGRSPNGTSGDTDRADATLRACYLTPGDNEPQEVTDISRAIHSNVPTVNERGGANNLGDFDVGDIIKLVCVSNNATLSGDGGHTASAIYVIFSDIAGNNHTSSRALYARRWDAGDFAQNPGSATQFADAFEGPANNGGEPARLDNESGDDVDVAPLFCAQRGTSALVIFRQNEHIWGNSSSDGANWLTDNGRPDPQLADDDTGHDVEPPPFAPQWTVDFCDDGKGDALDFILLFGKQDGDDADATVRARGRPNRGQGF